MILTSCASKVQETSLIQMPNTEGQPEGLKGVNDARLHARADFHSALSPIDRSSLAMGPPNYRIQQLQDKTDTYIQVYMNEYPKEIARTWNYQQSSQTQNQAIKSIFIGVGILTVVVLVVAIRNGLI